MEVHDNSRYAHLASPEAIEKTAEPPAYDPSTYVRQAVNRKIWQFLLSGAGAGLLVRGLMGAGRSASSAPGDFAPTYQPVSIPLLPEDAAEAEEVLDTRRAKRADADDSEPALSSHEQNLEKQSGDPPAAPPAPTAPTAPTDMSAYNPVRLLANLTKGWTDKKYNSDFLNWFTGQGAKNMLAVPALWAVGVPGAVGTFGLTYKLADKLLDARRGAELKSREKQLQREYERIVAEMMAKRGNDVHAELDVLADLVLEKCAWFGGLGDAAWAGAKKLTHKLVGEPAYEVSRYAGGPLLMWAILSSLGTGLMAHKYFKKRGLRSTTEAAVRRRQKERFGGVAPIYLQPSSLDVALEQAQ